MNPEQAAAFKVGAGYAPGELAFFISAIAAVVLFLFVAWVLMSAYRGWSERSLASGRLGGSLLRIALLMLVFLLVIAI